MKGNPSKESYLKAAQQNEQYYKDLHDYHTISAQRAQWDATQARNAQKVFKIAIGKKKSAKQ
jgi:hypothetical protein